jgi:hypothetical protein
MATNRPLSWIAAACLLAGVGTTTVAQVVNDGLSPEAQKYAKQDPSEVLRTLKSRLDKTPATEVMASCPAIPVEGLAGLTSDDYYFLTQIGGCAQLACFLKQVPSTRHAASTLIVDEACSGARAINETLVLPDRFTIAGVGIDGEGILGFDLPDNVPAIRFAPSANVVNRMATVRDLNIAGACCCQDVVRGEREVLRHQARNLGHQSGTEDSHPCQSLLEPADRRRRGRDAEVFQHVLHRRLGGCQSVLSMSIDVDRLSRYQQMAPIARRRSRRPPMARSIWFMVTSEQTLER